MRQMLAECAAGADPDESLLQLLHGSTDASEADPEERDYSSDSEAAYSNCGELPWARSIDGTKGDPEERTCPPYSDCQSPEPRDSSDTPEVNPDEGAYSPYSD